MKLMEIVLTYSFVMSYNQLSFDPSESYLDIQLFTYVSLQSHAAIGSSYFLNWNRALHDLTVEYLYNCLLLQIVLITYLLSQLRTSAQIR